MVADILACVDGLSNQSPSWTLIRPNNRSPRWTLFRQTIRKYGLCDVGTGNGIIPNERII